VGECKVLLHMEVWTNNGMSLSRILPRFGSKRQYLIFGKERTILATLRKGPVSEVPSGDYEDSENDVTELPEGSRSESLLIFIRWITIFVAHFLAKRTLEFHAARHFQSSPNTFEKPKIRILAVKSENYDVPKWDDFKRVIREAFIEGKDKVDDIITILEESVKDGAGIRPEAYNSLNSFRNIMEGRTSILKMCMHCEAVFLALLDARRRAQSKKSSADTDNLETLAKFFKVLGLVCLSQMYSYFPRPCRTI
jgi:hypothetical protein